MKIAATAVSTSNMKKTVEFYTLLGFKLTGFKDDEQHLEPITNPGEPRLMIDTHEMMESILGEQPRPGNHSSFAIEYDDISEVDEVVNNVVKSGFKVIKDPWEAFWGQYYAIIEDPDGYKVDLFVNL